MGASAVQTSMTKIMPMADTVLAQGTLQPEQGGSASVAAVMPGRIKQVLVVEGEHVTAGQPVAVLDYSTQQAMAQGASAALTAAQQQAEVASLAAKAAAQNQASSLQLAQQQLAAAQQQSMQSIAIAQTGVKTAEAELSRLRAGARPQQLEQAQQAVVQAAATESHAENQYTREEYLFKNGVASKSMVEDAHTAYTIAKANLTSAQQQVSLLKAGARPQDITAAQLKVEAAKTALQQARTQAAASVAQAKTALIIAKQGALQVAAKDAAARAMRTTVLQKQADLTAAAAAAGYSVLKSPITGVVVHRALNAGDMAETTVPIVEISNIAKLDLNARIPAESGVKVRPGMRATITTPDLPGKSFSGVVTLVGQVDPLTSLMSIRIAVGNSSQLLKQGMFATASIIIRVNKRALVVPKEAIVSNEKGEQVFVVGEKNIAHEVDVTLGPQQDGLVEVDKGLKPGQQVITVGQYELSEGSPVKPVSPHGGTQ